jgi:anti-sigma factor RsiW
MTHHISDDLMRRFTLGDLDEQVAIAVAEHIDDCPRCAARAAVADPLAGAFASACDPLPPPDLAGAILTALQNDVRPSTSIAAEAAASAVLLISAAAVLALGGDPAGLAAEAATAAMALLTALSVLVTTLSVLPAWWAAVAAALGFVACALVAGRLGAWTRGWR